MAVDARMIFACAGDYDDACELLTHGALDGFPNEGIPSHKPLLSPLCAIAAFSVELYLKCILYDLGCTSIPQSHNLKELFDNLPKQTRQQLHKAFRNHPQQIKLLGFLASKQINPAPYGLEEQLDGLGDAFESWRYRFELKKDDLCIDNFAIVRSILRAFIVKRHPDWDQDEDKYFQSTFPAP